MLFYLNASAVNDWIKIEISDGENKYEGKLSLQSHHFAGLGRWLSSSECWFLLQRTQVWFPASTWWLTTVLSSSSRGSHPFFWPPQAMYTNGTHIHWDRKLTHLKIKNKFRIIAVIWTLRHQRSNMRIYQKLVAISSGHIWVLMNTA